jgi:hypothetical protein
MPIRPCSKDGKHGYKWGDGGNCIIRSTPEEAKKVVIRQGIKIEGPDKFKKIMEKEKGWTREDKTIAYDIINESRGGWYSALTQNIIAEFAKKSVENTTQVDQFGKKKKKNPPIDFPNDHSETSFTTMADQVETYEDKERNAQDIEDDNEVKTKDANASQVYNLKEKQREDEEDLINVKNPTT